MSDRTLIPTLDGWRAVAIGAVIFAHARMELYPAGEGLAFRCGNFGVSLFFAISGFLITTLLLNEERDWGGISLRSFYLRRAFRILPAAFTFLFMIAAAAQFGWISLKHGEVLASMFFANNYWPNRSWYTAHFWSLSLEEHFYLIWPFVLAKASSRRAVWFAVAGIIATTIWRPFGFKIYSGIYQLHRTDMRLDAFMYAAAIAILVHRNRCLRFFKCRWTGVAGAGLLLVTYVVGHGATGLGADLKQSLEALLMPVIVVSAVYCAGDPIYIFLEIPLLGSIGRISYSLYLWQEVFLSPAVPVRLALQLTGLVACAWASCRWIENPCRRFIRRVLRERKPRRFAAGDG